MKDEQLKIQESLRQTETDNINLDYSKWSFERRRANLPTNHELWTDARDQTLTRQQSDNAELRAKYLSKLDDEKKARQAETDAAIDRELEPQKQRLVREWLANNPNLTASDFESKAWIHLRQNLVEERTESAREAELKRQLSTFRY